MPSYAEAHANPAGPGDARPTALQIVKDNEMEGKLAGKSVVVTGVSSGLGVETTRALIPTGAKLFLTARNLSKAKTVLADIWDDNQMELVEMDQNSLASVRKAADSILAKTDEISILIANAGVMAIPELEKSEDGFEKQFAVNHLSHFLLFQLLEPALLKGSTPAFQSRVVVVSAAAHRVSRIAEPGDYSFEKSAYDAWGAYARSKMANIYMSNEIERRFGAQGIHSTSLHPGLVQTSLADHIPREFFVKLLADVMHEIKSVEQGSATTLVAAVGKEWEGRGGVYLSDCAPAERGEDDGVVSSPKYASLTYDEKDAARLWEDSLKMVGL